MSGWAVCLKIRAHARLPSLASPLALAAPAAFAYC